MIGGDSSICSGMMFGCSNDAYAGLDIIAEQHKSITSIHKLAAKEMWQSIGTMHGQGYHMQAMFGPGPLDEAEARKSFQAMAEAQKSMFELQIDARKKVDAVLTKDQREKLSRYWSSRQFRDRQSMGYASRFRHQIVSLCHSRSARRNVNTVLTRSNRKIF
jgi:Spy/CpxP family protein refolding chaperone